MKYSHNSVKLNEVKIMDGKWKLANRLKQARENAELTQRHLATLLGYKNHSLISKIENAERIPSIKQIGKMREVLNLPSHELAALFVQVQREKAEKILL